MHDIEVALKAMVDQPHSPPPPVHELERRVAHRRRRRGMWRVAAIAAVVLGVAAAVPLLNLDDRGTVVRTGPAPDIAVGPAATEPVHSDWLDLQVPDAWQTLNEKQGMSRAVGTRKLTDRDLALALLARDDPVFQYFPADGVVFVVGGDALEAKYGGGGESVTFPGGVETHTSIESRGPGPSRALGDPKTLPGGIRVRRGDLPTSIYRLAAYLGPDAPDAAIRQAESMASTVRLIPGPGGAPPPPGSRPGFDAGPVPVPADRLIPVVQTAAGGYDLTLGVGEGCAVMTAGTEPVAGACPKDPRPERVAVVGTPIHRFTVASLTPRLGGPGAVDLTMVMLRAGPSATTVHAVLVDGTSVEAKLGADGWGMAAAEGRIYFLEARDAAGDLVGGAPVG